MTKHLNSEIRYTFTIVNTSCLFLLLKLARQLFTTLTNPSSLTILYSSNFKHNHGSVMNNVKTKGRKSLVFSLVDVF